MSGLVQDIHYRMTCCQSFWRVKKSVTFHQPWINCDFLNYSYFGYYCRSLCMNPTEFLLGNISQRKWDILFWRLYLYQKAIPKLILPCYLTLQSSHFQSNLIFTLVWEDSVVLTCLKGIPQANVGSNSFKNRTLFSYLTDGE